ncbi:response regulator transcription factor [Mycoplana rhizolycopersici]|uniref:Response regulator transcription factor n=1 Tax=Mycoplana rhizolycopersici TaxID=2746702 RepID=A0ABX2QN23_9HYPH|nr:response regulator [Rhizobium rhizolycopersici]NVP58292.1 response regulator transcription factor [Rhizobium rhizolycopersici]
MESHEMDRERLGEPVVHVIDDDKQVREALLDLFLVTHWQASAYSSGSEFLDTVDTTGPGCIVIDLRMPGESGLEVQSRLISTGIRMPVIFLTAHADVAASVKAMKAGACDFLTKPFVTKDLLAAVGNAIRIDGERRKLEAERDQIGALANTLTPREEQVMFGVVSGLMNKQVAYELGISEMTVKLHRMSVMRKMQSRSLADLVRKVEKLRKN